MNKIVSMENRHRKPWCCLISVGPRETIEYMTQDFGLTMNKFAAIFAHRIGDCLGAVAAGVIALIISLRSPEEQAFIYLALPLITLGLLSTAIALTHKG